MPLPGNRTLTIAKARTKPVRLAAFNAAWYHVAPSLLLAGATGEPVRIPATWCVVQHPRGVVLIDTGVDLASFPAEDEPDDPEAPRRGMGFDTHESLSALGLHPAQVSIVVNTHLHVDHAGQNRRFPHARFVVRCAELDYALAPDDPVLAAEYDPEQVASGRLVYEPIPDERDVDLFSDGTVLLLATPGHSSGHQSVLVRLTSGRPVLIAGDAIWTKELRDDPTRYPGLLWSQTAYDDSRARLLGLADRENPLWLLTHEPTFFDDHEWVEGAWIE